MMLHPDKNINTIYAHLAEELLKLVNIAYGTLSDSDKEKNYKQTLQSANSAKVLADAIYFRDIKMIKKLNIQKVFLNQPYEAGSKTFMHLAAATSSAEIVEYLITKGADLSIKDDRGRTPIFLVIQRQKQSDVLSVLLNKGSEPNVRNNDGNTPLHLGVKNGSFDYCNALLKAGSNVNIENHKGETAYQIALRKRDSSNESAISQNYARLANLISQYDTQILSQKINQLEEKNQQMENQINTLLNQMKTIQENMLTESIGSTEKNPQKCRLFF